MYVFSLAIGDHCHQPTGKLHTWRGSRNPLVTLETVQDFVIPEETKKCGTESEHVQRFKRCFENLEPISFVKNVNNRQGRWKVSLTSHATKAEPRHTQEYEPALDAVLPQCFGSSRARRWMRRLPSQRTSPLSPLKLPSEIDFFCGLEFPRCPSAGRT